jgi:CheY-like chemotaxis protein
LALGLSAPEDAGPDVATAGATAQRPLSILLAEDSLVNQKLALGLLRKRGHRIQIANNGQEALAALEAQPFDLVLMDVQMPEMDGLEATALIRRREAQAGGHVPIVAMTAHAMKGDRERCLEAGMDGYVSKPIRAEELFETIAACCPPATPAVDPVEEASAVDWLAALEAVQGDRELLKVVAQAFLEESPQILAQIEQALDTSDPPLLQRAAHTFKGALKTFGEGTTVELALQLEILGKQGQLASAAGLLASLKQETVCVTHALAAFVQTGAFPSF